MLTMTGSEHKTNLRPSMSPVGAAHTLSGEQKVAYVRFSKGDGHPPSIALEVWTLHIDRNHYG